MINLNDEEWVEEIHLHCTYERGIEWEKRRRKATIKKRLLIYANGAFDNDNNNKIKCNSDKIESLDGENRNIRSKKKENKNWKRTDYTKNGIENRRSTHAVFIIIITIIINLIRIPYTPCINTHTHFNLSHRSYC